MSRYLLPCSCGRKLEIETGDAGRTVHCECGIALEVPTIRGLDRLKRIAAEVPARRSWGLRERLVLLGLLVAVTGFSLTVFFHTQRPADPDFAIIREQVQKMRPEMVMERWSIFAERGLHWASNDDVYNYQSERLNSSWMWISLVVGVIGLAMAVASYFLLPKQSRRNTAGAAEPATAARGRRRR